MADHLKTPSPSNERLYHNQSSLEKSINWDIRYNHVLHPTQKESLFAVKIRMSWLSAHPSVPGHHQHGHGMTQIRNSFRSIFATSCPVSWVWHSSVQLRPQQWRGCLFGRDFQPPRNISLVTSSIRWERQIQETLVLFAEKLILRTSEADDNDLFYLSLGPFRDGYVFTFMPKIGTTGV